MMVKVRMIHRLMLIVLMAAFNSCREVPIPKPKGYFRIDLPEKEYIKFDQMTSKAINMPFTFEYPSYGYLSFQEEEVKESSWFNIEFPAHRAKIYLTYMDVKNNINDIMEETYRMNIKNHISKADAINEQIINNPESKVYGVLYELKGNTATAVQFYVIDSVNHYLRGSLYFSAEPNADSLAPVINYFREDIIHLIETLKWKDK